MNIVKTSLAIAPLIMGSLLVGGCATETAAFRGMTAVDHERAAGGQGPDGATAAEHAAAAKRLRDAELAACAEVPDADRDQGPFARRERITGVEEVRDRVYAKGMKQPFGVVVYLRATPGVTEQWVRRVTECHLAHHAVVGWNDSERVSPLSEDARIAVSTTGTGFRVSITSPDVDVARSVIRKASTL